MKKHQITIILLVVVFLSACTSQINPVTPTATVPLPETWKALDDTKAIYYFSPTISPNGEWVINANGREPEQIISIENPMHRIVLNYDLHHQGDTNNEFGFRSWSPDSSIIIGTSVDGPKGCCSTGMALASFEKGQITDTFILRWEYQGGPGISWSEDSSKFALSFGSGQKSFLWIVDRHGNVLNKSSFPRSIWGMLWVGQQILILDDENSLYSFDVENKTVEKFFAFVTAQNHFLSLIEYDKLSKQVILEGPLSGDDYTIFFFDLENRKLLPKRIKFQPTHAGEKVLIQRVNTSTSLQYIGILTSETGAQTGPIKDKFYIYDVRKQELKYYTEAGELQGWYPNLNGFLVTYDDADLLHTHNKIIRP